MPLRSPHCCHSRSRGRLPAPQPPSSRCYPRRSRRNPGRSGGRANPGMRPAFHRRPVWAPPLSPPPGSPLASLHWTQILVPFQIVSRGTDAGDIGPAVRIQIRNGASGCRDSTVIQRLAVPALPIETINVDSLGLAAEPGDDLIRAVTLKIGRYDRMSIQEASIDHLPLPRARSRAINRNLITVPWLNRREVSLSAKLAHRNVARPALRPRRRVAFRT